MLLPRFVGLRKIFPLSVTLLTVVQLLVKKCQISRQYLVLISEGAIICLVYLKNNPKDDEINISKAVNIYIVAAECSVPQSDHFISICPGLPSKASTRRPSSSPA